MESNGEVRPPDLTEESQSQEREHQPLRQHGGDIDGRPGQAQDLPALVAADGERGQTENDQQEECRGGGA